MAAAAEDALEAYLPRFGLSSFRAGQREVISTILSGQDCLCVMPTGGGKSLCYQLPAIARPGLTLVVTPLIALMKDQVDGLTARGLSATFINSTLSPAEQAARLDGMTAGRYQLVYVVPERFRSSRFLEAVGRSRLQLLAIDEAHCISEWGHDFRPDYARLGWFRQQLGNPPTIALTATATDTVRRDIVDLLNLRDPRLFITGFVRPNLFYSVGACASDRDKDEALFDFLQQNSGAGIVYASTRKRCEDLGARIAERTLRRTTVYHAGLPADDRRLAQDDFMQGRTEIAVATLAFGMGIDKADVRFVVHYNLPGSIEAYYQEAGRAGRDGQPARCLMLFGGGDRQIHEFFIESAYPGRDVVKKVYEFLCASDANPIEMTQQEIKESLRLQIGGEGVGACEKLLEGAGALDRLEAAENTAAIRLNSDLPTVVDLLPTQAKVRRQVLRALERMVGPRRYQWCYFQPRELLRELTDFDSSSLARNLRELSALAAVDYVPPFRGRAIHIRDRKRRFEELSIDFETLDRHKAAELERIEHVLRFARGRTCRQQHIVSYFGESDAQPCGHCDNCAVHGASEQTADARPATPQVLEVARIVLSGVARISRSRRGCGKQLLAQMLCGAQTKPVVRNRLDKLSTFGLLTALRQSEVVQVVDALLIAGLLEQTEIEPFRPVLQLTEAGNDVMSGRALLIMDLRLPEALLNKLRRLPGLAKGEPSTFDVEASDDDARSDDLDADLLERLRAWRQATCKAQSVPAYIVLSNAALEELARVRPQSVETLLQVKGIGPAKVRQYGDALMEILHAAVRPPVLPSAPHIVAKESPTEELEHGACEPDVRGSPEEATVVDELTSQTPAATVAPSEVSRPSHYWTWRLLKSGYAPQEIAEIRSLSEEVVLDHALRAAESGFEIDASWFMPTALVERIEKVIGPGTPARIRPLLEHLPRGTRWEHVQLVLKARCGATAAR